jgi:uncharacterized membrane protein YesL
MASRGESVGVAGGVRSQSGLRGLMDRVMAAVGLLGSVILVSLMWSALAILVLPLPAATAALFWATGRAAADVAGNPFGDFVYGLRAHWRRATAIGGPALFLGIVVGVDALFLVSQPHAGARAIGWIFASLGLLWSALLLLLWPALVFRPVGWRQLVKETFWLAMATLPVRLSAVVLAAAMIVVAVAYPVLLPFAPGIVALLASWLALRSFRRYGLPIVTHEP